MNRKNLGLIIGFLTIFSMALTPTVLLINQKPKIIYETVIEQYYNNNTVIINNTEYLPINRTIEYYHFASVQPNDFFFNATFNITFGSVSFVVFTVNSFLRGTQPTYWLYKNGSPAGTSQIDFSGMVGYLWTSGFYEVRFENYNMIQNIDIAIETIEI